MKIAFFGLKEQESKDFFKRALSNHQVLFYDLDLNQNQLPNETDFDIISIFVGAKLTSQTLEKFPNLKMIALRATGFDNIDLDYTKQKNIILSNVPAYGSHTVAEFTFGLILSLSRKIPQAIEQVKQKIEFNHDGLKGFDLNEKILGVIGTGKIGINVIKIAKGFNMTVLAYDKYPDSSLSESIGFKYVALDELLKSSDIVTIHVPANTETHHLINTNNIYNLKKGALLINTARGDIVETKALYDAINQKHLLGAGLDVLEGETNLDKDKVLEEHEPSIMEQIIEDNYLIKDPNVIITPHTAFYTNEAEDAILKTTVENIQSFINNSPVNKVN